MTTSEREYLEGLERRIRELERTRRPAVPRGALVLVPLLAVAVLSGATTSGGLGALEGRLALLESVIRPGPDSSLAVKAPFKVIGAGGAVLLNVADRGAGGLVNIATVAGWPGAVLSMHHRGGAEMVSMGVSPDGTGRIATNDAQGKLSVLIGEGGLNVQNPQGELVAGVTRGGGLGRVGVWHKGKLAAELTADAAGNGGLKAYGPAGTAPVVSLGGDPQRGNAGALTLMSAAGRIVAAVGGTPAGTAGIMGVFSASGKQVAGLTAGLPSGGAVVVTDASGVGLAQMSVSNEGRGLVQIFGRNQRPLAVLTEATDGPGGLLQISGNTQPTANLSVAPDGSGRLLLTNAAGLPTVEAGTLPSGRGTVRVGPQYDCNPVKPATPVIGIPGFEDCLVGKLGK